MLVLFISDGRTEEHRVELDARRVVICRRAELSVPPIELVLARQGPGWCVSDLASRTPIRVGRRGSAALNGTRALASGEVIYSGSLIVRVVFSDTASIPPTDDWALFLGPEGPTVELVSAALAMAIADGAPALSDRTALEAPRDILEEEATTSPKVRRPFDDDDVPTRHDHTKLDDTELPDDRPPRGESAPAHDATHDATHDEAYDEGDEPTRLDLDEPEAEAPTGRSSRSIEVDDRAAEAPTRQSSRSIQVDDIHEWAVGRAPSREPSTVDDPAGGPVDDRPTPFPTLDAAVPDAQTLDEPTGDDPRLHALVGDATRVDEPVSIHDADLGAAPIADTRPIAPTNPTQPWDGATAADHIVVERLDTSNEPVALPNKVLRRDRLVFFDGPHAERQVFLGTGPLTLGRAEDSDVVLHDPQVDLHHCRIEGGRLTTLSTRNHPTINGREVATTREIQPGDVIAIGASLLRLHVFDPKRTSSTGGWTANHTTVQVKLPRFCFRGDVAMQVQLTIGRDPTCDLYLDHPSVSRHHARVVADSSDSFSIIDESETGLYLDGERILHHKLRTGDVLHVGSYRLQFDIDTLLCNIHIAEPAFGDLEQFAFDLDGSSPQQVMYRVVPSANDGDAVTSKASSSRTWAQPRDVERSWRVPLVVAAAVAVTTSLVLGLADGGGGTFLRRPMSQVHQSSEFEDDARARFADGDRCASCHQAFEGPVEQRCVSCHGNHPLRPAHAKANLQVPTRCNDCHVEHRMGNNGPALLAGDRCAACHEDRHERLFATTDGLAREVPPRREGFTVDLKADLAWSEGLRQAELHRIHGKVDRRCTACHLDAAGTRVSAYSACLRCHMVVSELRSERCGDCHREHGDSWSSPMPPTTSLAATPLTVTAVSVLMLLLPLGFVIGAHHLSRRRIEERAAARREAEDAAQVSRVATQGKLVHNINIDKCVGCASCVNACPHDVLELEPVRHKSTVVRFDDCNQCRACEQICPSGALTMAPAGAPPRMIELPDLDANYMTNIEGVYLIGEAAGKSLVKNANNLGYRVVQHMLVDGLEPGVARKRGFDAEVLIVGSGPGGLAAGITACENGLGHIIFEKDRRPFSTIQTYPKGKELLEEPPDVKNIGPLPVWDSYKEEILDKWHEVLAGFDLDIRTSDEVRGVEPIEGGFRVTTASGVYTGVKVVLATGTRGNPRRLEIPGGDNDNVHYVLVDAAAHDGEDCLVVGGGDTAAETAIALADVNGGTNRVALSYRRDAFTRIKRRNLEVLERYVADGRIRLLMSTRVIGVQPGSVSMVGPHETPEMIANDVVFCMLGADPPTAWLERIGIQYVKKPESWSPGATDDIASLELQRRAS